MIDRGTASRFGITSQLIDDTLYDAFGQRQVSDHVHAPESVPRRDGGRAEVLAASGDAARHLSAGRGRRAGAASALARYAPTNTSLAVNHQSQFPAVTISFNLPPGVALGEAVGAIQDATAARGASVRHSRELPGHRAGLQAALANQPLLIVAALVSVYIVLGVLYESYVHPITILSTLPSAGVGAILALLLCRTDLSRHRAHRRSSC